MKMLIHLSIGAFFLLAPNLAFAQAPSFGIYHVVSEMNPKPLTEYTTRSDAIRARDSLILPNAKIFPFRQQVYFTYVDLNNISTSGTRIDERWLITEGNPIINQDDIYDCKDLPTEARFFRISCKVTPDAEERWGKWMDANINQYITPVLGNEAFGAAYIKSRISDYVEINGILSNGVPNKMVAALNSNAAKVKLRGRGNTYTSTAIDGYLDITQPTSAGCRISVIVGDRVFLGTITFARLSILTQRRIVTYEEALSAVDGKRFRISLAGTDLSCANSTKCTFTEIIRLTSLPNDAAANQPLNEQSSPTETVVNLSTDILFDFNKSTVNPKAVPTLIRLVRLLRQSNGNNVQLNGFTDSIGTDEYNIGLSQRRAEAVKQWLVSKGGVDAGRLNTHGYGKAQTVAPNTNVDGSDSPIGRKKNRRVEIRIPKS